MAETPNLDLYVSSNDQEDFLNWRDKIAGENGSNFHKIDDAFKKLSDDIDNIPIGSPDAITIPAGGEIFLDSDLKETVGDGSYTLEFTPGNEDAGGSGSGGGGSIPAATPNTQHSMCIAPNILINGTAPFVNQLGFNEFESSKYNFPVDGWQFIGSKVQGHLDNVSMSVSNYGTSEGHCRQYIQFDYEYKPYLLSMAYYFRAMDGTSSREGFLTFGGINKNGTEVEYCRKSLGFGGTGSIRMKSLSFEITDENISEWPVLYYVDITVPSMHDIQVHGIKLEENTTQTLWWVDTDGIIRILKQHQYWENLLGCQQYLYAMRFSVGGATAFMLSGLISSNRLTVITQLTLPTKMACNPIVVTESLGITISVNGIEDSGDELELEHVFITPISSQYYTLVFKFANTVGPANTACWLHFHTGWLALVADIKADALE